FVDFVCFESSETLIREVPFFKALPKNITVELFHDVFLEATQDMNMKLHIDWAQKCIPIYSDQVKAMTDVKNGFMDRLKKQIPSTCWVHCFLHRHVLAAKTRHKNTGTKRERSRSRNGSRSGSSSPEQFRVKQSSHYEKDAIRISSRTLLKPSGSRNRDPHSSFYLESVRFNPDYKNKKYPNDQCTRKSWPKYPQAQPKPISVLFVVQYLFTIKNDLGSLAPLITSILQKAFEAEKAFKGGSNTLLNDISVVNTLDTAKEKLLERITSGTMDKEARKHAKKGIDYILKMYSTILQSRTSENAVAV
ncbi:hypothetical protein QYM36_012979, partial [Artemia franciscana]